jgi:hypothetical protein
MSQWLQSVVALLLVAVCAGVVLSQFIRTFSGTRSKLGSCCNKGCPPAKSEVASEGREQFVSSDALRRSVKNRK